MNTDLDAITLASLAEQKRWVAWRNERRKDKLTKVPYCATDRNARSDDSATWRCHDEAAALAETIVNGDGGGCGIMLGLSGDTWLGGADLDCCRDPRTGELEPWARQVIARLGTYVEISPSGTGAKAFFLIDPADIPKLRSMMRTGKHGRQWKRANGSDHPPAIELHISNRYFAVTWQTLDDAPAELRTVPLDDLKWLIEEAGPMFEGRGERAHRRSSNGRPERDETQTPAGILERLDVAGRNNRGIGLALQAAATMRGGSRSEGAMGLGAALRRAGWSFEDIKAGLVACPATKEWATEKLAEGDRAFQRIWDRAAESEQQRQPSGSAGDKPRDDKPKEPNAALLSLLSIDGWMAREIPPPDRLLGDLVTTTIRVFLVGRTGLGKTMLGLGMAVAMASGTSFLHWPAGRPCKALYLDGEMPAELIKARLIDALRRAGNPALGTNLITFGYDLDEQIAKVAPTLSKREPLNTEAGQNWLFALIAELGGVDVIVFDNVMSWLLGVQKEEESWRGTLPLIVALTARRIGQIWLDHTGHNSDRQYGTSTKSWGFDTAGVMTPLPDGERKHNDVAFVLSFDPPGKARRRTPDNRADFETVVIRLERDRWTSAPADPEKHRGKLKPSRQPFYDALVAAVGKSAVGQGRTTEDTWKLECLRRGLIEKEPADEFETRAQRSNRYAPFRAAKSDLLTARWIVIEDDLVADLKHSWGGGWAPDPARDRTARVWASQPALNEHCPACGGQRFWVLNPAPASPPGALRDWRCAACDQPPHNAVLIVSTR